MHTVVLLKPELVSQETPFGKKNLLKEMTVMIIRSTVEDRTHDKLHTELDEMKRVTLTYGQAARPCSCHLPSPQAAHFVADKMRKIAIYKAHS
jgi:hypothetical protein